MYFNTWQIPDFLEKRENGRLHINNINTEKLAQKYGTPLFVFSQDRIIKNIKDFKKAFSKYNLATKICYACKANSNMAILQTIHKEALDIEVNSGGELFKALKAGFQPHQIIFNGVAKTVDELRSAILTGIYCLNIDSTFELTRVIELCRSLKRKVRIALRIVPEVRDGADLGLETGTYEGKFGLAKCEIPEACQLISQADEWLDVISVHGHIGSQTSKINSYIETLKQLLIYREHIYTATGHLLLDINIGGGFPIEYLKDGYYEKEGLLCNMRANFQINQLAKAINTFLKSGNFTSQYLSANTLKNIRLILEPGRSIIGNTGILLTKVQNYKTRPRSLDRWLILDAGFNILLESFDYKWYFHTLAANHIDKPHTSLYKLAGPLCDAGDVFFDLNNINNNGENNGKSAKFATCRLLPQGMKAGDTIAFLDIGAYTLEQMFPYNGRPCPQVIMIDTSGTIRTIRRPDTYEDLISKDVFS